MLLYVSQRADKKSRQGTPCHCDASPSLAPGSIDHPGGAADQEGTNVLHGVTEKYAIGLQRNIAQVGRNHRVLQPAEGMVERQRLLVKDVQTRPGNSPLLQCLDERWLFDNRTT